MKKILLLGAASLFIAGCSHQATQEQTQEQSTEQAAQEYAQVGMAIQQGKSVQCIMTHPEEGTITYYHKGEKARTMADNGHMMMDGEYIYTWDQDTKEGVKFKQPDPAEMAEAKDAMEQDQELIDFSEAGTQERYQNDGYTVDCEVKDVDDSLFIVPTDVTFTDTSAMMESALKMMQGDQNQAEMEKAGQEMMEKYGQGQDKKAN